MQRSLALGVAIPIALTAAALVLFAPLGALLVFLSGSSPTACLLWYARTEKRSRQAAVTAAFEQGAAAERYLHPRTTR